MVTRRRSIRYFPYETLSAMLTFGERVVSASLHDISSDGIGIDLPIEAAEGLPLAFSDPVKVALGNNLGMHVEGLVRYATRLDDRIRLGVFAVPMQGFLAMLQLVRDHHHGYIECVGESLQLHGAVGVNLATSALAAHADGMTLDITAAYFPDEFIESLVKKAVAAT